MLNYNFSFSIKRSLTLLGKFIFVPSQVVLRDEKSARELLHNIFLVTKNICLQIDKIVIYLCKISY